ncbi:isocitrate lyase/PEP mutase family protein [Solicola gregarius]|uniref:Isocitrate lyase/phosphoenolpyruvate mutase family protein n=1 Tax=Solicola gregarius TaxID=2908642 RepID=A0AA46TLF1_9ACTN|nr:isocitrate lyase/phosphoenolpyruvate mutase family protein [Solicola gregarius]UYM07441.1 isocitrate lyase/phosphoenolpyruvate mutase family protein [Solicola gregarius]
MTLADLHRGPTALLLPNAWDIASALAFLEAGYAAIGTTSLGVAASNGQVDAARASSARTRSVAHALRVLPCPVTVDIEDGFDDDPARVAAYVEELGVDGVNVEDSTNGTLVDPAAHGAKVAAIKQRCGDRVFVNARVETYWLGQDATVEHTLDRARRYIDVGADGIFVPGSLDREQLSALASGLSVPLNVLPQPGVSLDELSALGVRRVSSGSLPFRAALSGAVAALDHVRAGTAPQATAYGEVQRLSAAYERMSP